MKKKSVFCTVLVYLMVITFAACSAKSDTPKKKTASKKTESIVDSGSAQTNVTSSMQEITTSSVVETTSYVTVSGKDDPNEPYGPQYAKENVTYNNPDGKPLNLKVKSFGAKGDGVTDDAAAIYKAVSALCSAPKGSVLEFEKGKTYYYKDNAAPTNAVFYLKNNNCITIKGNGAIIKLGGTKNYYADISGCKDIAIEGLSFDYAEYKPAFMASAVRDVNLSEGSAVVTADRDIHLENGESYPAGELYGAVATEQSRHHMYLFKYEMLDSKKREVKIYFDKSNALTMSRLNNDYIYTYGFVLPMPFTGNKIERGFSVSGNENFTMKNVNIYSVPKHVFSLQYNKGSFLFNNVKVVRAPYDKNLKYTSWADCYHLLHNRAKFKWIKCKNEWNFDDVFNISAVTHNVTQVYSQKEFRMVSATRESTDSVIPGDTLCIINTKTGALIGRTKVKSVIADDGKSVRVKMVEELPLLKAGENIYLWVDDTVAPGSEFVNCDFDGTFRARSDLKFTNCRFVNKRFWIGLETISHEGPLGKNIIFKNCVFEGDNAWEVSSCNSNKNGYHLTNIVFEKCKNINKKIVGASSIDEVIFR